jgi:hypothetical protein
MVQHAKEGGHYKVVGKPFVVDVKFDFEDDEILHQWHHLSIIYYIVESEILKNTQ